MELLRKAVTFAVNYADDLKLSLEFAQKLTVAGGNYITKERNLDQLVPLEQLDENVIVSGQTQVQAAESRVGDVIDKVNNDEIHIIGTLNALRVLFPKVDEAICGSLVWVTLIYEGRRLDLSHGSLLSVSMAANLDIHFVFKLRDGALLEYILNTDSDGFIFNLRSLDELIVTQLPVPKCFECIDVVTMVIKEIETRYAPGFIEEAVVTVPRLEKAIELINLTRGLQFNLYDRPVIEKPTITQSVIISENPEINAYGQISAGVEQLVEKEQEKNAQTDISQL